MPKGRNANGDGSFYEDKAAGLWVGAITIAGKRWKVTSKDKKKAAEKFRELKRQAMLGQLVVSSDALMIDFLGQWLDDVKRHAVRAHSFEVYYSDVKMLCRHLGDVKLKDLKPQMIQHCLTALLDEGLQPRTVHHAFTRLSSALKYAVKMGMIPSSPSRGVQAPRIQPATITFLNEAQLGDLLESTNETRFGPLWALIGHTGLRIGEACALRWTKDISLAECTVTVNRTTSPVVGVGVTFNPPKTKASRRTVHFAPELAETLARWKMRQAKERNGTGYWLEGDLIFCDESGQPYRNQRINDQLRQACRPLNLPNITVHELRHTYASILLHHGVPIKHVSEALGHSKIQTTLDLYAHVMPSMHQDAAKLMGDLLRPKRYTTLDSETANVQSEERE